MSEEIIVSEQFDFECNNCSNVNLGVTVDGTNIYVNPCENCLQNKHDEGKIAGYNECLEDS